MRKIITTIVLSLFAFNFASAADTVETKLNTNPACPVGELTLKHLKNKRTEWSLLSGSNHAQWLMIKNKDNKRMYPVMKVTKDRGVVGPFEKNKNGYDLMVIEASQSEDAAIKADQTGCSKKGDCSLKIKLNRCIIDQKSI